MLGKKDNGAIAGGQTLNTIIGRGTVFEGTIKVENSVRIDGVFKGELSCSGALTISQSGESYAHLEGTDIYINGTVRGTVRAEKVRLDSQARFIGDIYTSALSVAEGAIFHGSCSMDAEGEGKLGAVNGQEEQGKSSVEKQLASEVAKN
jgi:cytoskeletal protein CcmA (bactofilin family)